MPFDMMYIIDMQLDSFYSCLHLEKRLEELSAPKYYVLPSTEIMHFIDVFWWMFTDAADTAAALQSLALNQGPDVRQTKIALGALATLLLKKRGPVIAKAEAEDTEAAVAAMVEVAGSTHRRGKSIDKVGD